MSKRLGSMPQRNFRNVCEQQNIFFRHFSPNCFAFKAQFPSALASFSFNLYFAKFAIGERKVFERFAASDRIILEGSPSYRVCDSEFRWGTPSHSIVSCFVRVEGRFAMSERDYGARSLRRLGGETRIYALRMDLPHSWTRECTFR